MVLSKGKVITIAVASTVATAVMAATVGSGIASKVRYGTIDFLKAMSVTKEFKSFVKSEDERKLIDYEKFEKVESFIENPSGKKLVAIPEENSDGKMVGLEIELYSKDDWKVLERNNEEWKNKVYKIDFDAVLLFLKYAREQSGKLIEVRSKVAVDRQKQQMVEELDQQLVDSVEATSKTEDEVQHEKVREMFYDFVEENAKRFADRGTPENVRNNFENVKKFVDSGFEGTLVVISSKCAGDSMVVLRVEYYSRDLWDALTRDTARFEQQKKEWEHQGECEYNLDAVRKFIVYEKLMNKRVELRELERKLSVLAGRLLSGGDVGLNCQMELANAVDEFKKAENLLTDYDALLRESTFPEAFKAIHHRSAEILKEKFGEMEKEVLETSRFASMFVLSTEAYGDEEWEEETAELSISEKLKLVRDMLEQARKAIAETRAEIGGVT